MDLEPVYLTKQHASTISSLKQRSLEQAIRNGWVRAFKIGRKVLIERQSLDDWIRAHEIMPMDKQRERSELQKLVDAAVEQAQRKVEAQNGARS